MRLSARAVITIQMEHQKLQNKTKYVYPLLCKSTVRKDQLDITAVSGTLSDSVIFTNKNKEIKIELVVEIDQKAVKQTNETNKSENKCVCYTEDCTAIMDAVYVLCTGATSMASLRHTLKTTGILFKAMAY